MSAPKKPKDRSPDQTLLGVSLPKALKERIRKAAARENRTMANWSAQEIYIAPSVSKTGSDRHIPIMAAELAADQEGSGP